jgi:hypothetical protein
METAKAWGQPMTRQQAEGRIDAAIARPRPWPWWGTVLAAFALGTAWSSIITARILGWM